jgi:hypothetical protein
MTFISFPSFKKLLALIILTTCISRSNQAPYSEEPKSKSKMARESWPGAHAYQERKEAARKFGGAV